MNVNLKGTELATYLAHNLSDLEFELLIRERIKYEFAYMQGREPNLYEGSNTCRFEMSWTDNAEWHVRIGENYSKSAFIEGQVLSRCCADVLKLYAMKNGNKLSLLLPAPVQDILEKSVHTINADFDDTEDKKW